MKKMLLKDFHKWKNTSHSIQLVEKMSVVEFCSKIASHTLSLIEKN